ncbi:unnamed protein product [Victoria cruziana]
MASLASLATLGSARVNSSTSFESSAQLSISLLRSLPSNAKPRRWSHFLSCKYVVTNDFITEKGDFVSHDPNFRNSKDEDADFVLNPLPKPTLKSRPSIEPVRKPLPRNTLPINNGYELSNEKSGELEDKNKVIESLNEVLEKAERLERMSKSDTSVNTRNGSRPSGSNNPNVAKVSNSTSIKKSKTLKSVWRKGNPVASVQKVVTDLPTSRVQKFQRKDYMIQDNSKVDIAEKRKSSDIASKAHTTLQAKPPARPVPEIKRPVILQDVGAVRGATIAKEETGNSMQVKDRKPILVDKFAKKPGADPLISQVILPPPKLARGAAQSKGKDERRKKSGELGASRRRMVFDGEEDIMDDDTNEIDMSISGASTARKGRKWSKASRKAARLQAAKAAAPVKVDILEVGEEGMTTEDLAYKLAVSETEILGYLFSKGIKVPVMHILDKDMVKMICKEYDVEVIEADPIKVEDMAQKKEMLDEDDLDKLEARPPVLTIMGHVDHGKVTESEAGGITQGIGAYKVLVPVDGKLQPCIVLDTPGHEAFSAMRARGARVTDIAIIVVAADDGVRPQTAEAVAHAKAAGVPIIVAINKIDKDGANPDKVMQEFSSIGLMPEDWGGDTPFVQISALKGQNIGELLETVMLIAELQELRANPHRNAKGTVIEAGLHKSKGPVATFIVQNGTLKRGAVVQCGESFGKVRALFDDIGNPVNEAGPSVAVQIIGLNSVPIAGDEFESVDSLDIARERAEACAESLRNERMSTKAGDGKVTLASLVSAVSSGKQPSLDMHQLNIIMKVDVQGSIEAIKQALQFLPQDNITLKFLMHAVGDVSISDVDLGVASKAIILGFNVGITGSVKKYAECKSVEVRIYKIIYELIDDIRNAMEGLLEPVEEQIPIGSADVRAVFSSGSGRVAGCMVTEGKLVKGCGVQVTRNGNTVHTGVLDSLRRVKEMVKEVSLGLECGVGMEDFIDWEVGDRIEAFNVVQKRRTLEEASASVAAALADAGLDF